MSKRTPKEPGTKILSNKERFLALVNEMSEEELKEVVEITSNFGTIDYETQWIDVNVTIGKHTIFHQVC